METINPEKLLLKVVPILDELQIDYFITGGFAISVWGRPRATFDIDIVVKLVEPKVRPLAKALREISKFGYIDEETAKEALKKGGEFNFIDPETGVKVDFWAKINDEKTKTQFDRRVIKTIDKQKIYFVSPEDLILNKLLWYRESRSSRHLEDIESVLKISKVNKKYLKNWVEKLDVSDIWEKIQKK